MAAAPRELVFNGSFESVDADGWAIGWDRLAGATIDRIAASGQRSLRLQAGAGEAGCTQHVRLVPGRRYVVFAQVRTRAVQGSGDASFKIEFFDSSQHLLSAVAPSGYGSTLSWRPLRVITDPVPAGTVSARLGLRLTSAQGAAWFDEVSIVEFSPAPLEARLLYPNFRGLMGERIWEPTLLRAGCDIGLQGTPLSKLSVEAQVIDARGHVDWVAAPAVPEARSFEMGFDVRWITEGDYTLRIDLSGADGAAIAREDLPFEVSHVVALTSRPVFISAARTLLARGTPLLPVGLMDSYDVGGAAAHVRRVRMLRGSPFDILVNRDLSSAPAASVVSAISDFALIGVRSVVPVARYDGVAGDEARDVLAGFPGRSIEARLASCARLLRDLPGFLGWQCADGLPVQYAPLVAERYRRLLELDPGHFAMSLHSAETREEILQHADGEDVACVKVEPGSNNSARTILAEAEALSGYRPTWAVVPLTSTSSGIFSRTDLRGATYDAFVAGASGVLYDSLDSLLASQDPSAAWRSVQSVAEELRVIEPYLLGGSSQPRISCSRARLAEHSRLIALGNRRLLVVVNPDNWSGTCTLTLEASPASISVLFENRQIEPVQGAFADHFLAKECHVYEIE